MLHKFKYVRSLLVKYIISFRDEGILQCDFDMYFQICELRATKLQETKINQYKVSVIIRLAEVGRETYNLLTSYCILVYLYEYFILFHG